MRTLWDLEKFCQFLSLDFFNSRPQPLKRLLFRRSSFFNSLLYFLITFTVLHESQFSRLTSDLPHSLFQLNGFEILSRIEFRNELNAVNVKRSKSKETGQTDKARSLVFEAYENVVFNFDLFFFLFLYQSRCASSASTAAIFQESAGFVSFQSQSLSSGSAEAFFRQFFGYV